MLPALIILETLSLAVMAYLVLTAPEGWEDETGLHLGNPVPPVARDEPPGNASNGPRSRPAAFQSGPFHEARDSQ